MQNELKMPIKTMVALKMANVSSYTVSLNLCSMADLSLNHCKKVKTSSIASLTSKRRSTHILERLVSLNATHTQKQRSQTMENVFALLHTLAMTVSPALVASKPQRRQQKLVM